MDEELEKLSENNLLKNFLEENFKNGRSYTVELRIGSKHSRKNGSARKKFSSTRRWFETNGKGPADRVYLLD